MSEQGGEQSGAGSVPAGWYRVDGGQQRYWDGAAWTEHVIPDPSSDPSPAAEPPPIEQPTIAQPPFDPNPGGPTGPSGAPAPGIPSAGESPFDPAPFAAQQPPAGHTTAAITGDDKNLAVLIHLLSLFSSFLAPLLIWLWKREESTFIDHHGKEALNFQITLAIVWFGVAIASLLLIGLLAIPFVALAHLIFPILAAVAASGGNWYRYPFTLRLIS